jgi:hypothetical protein
MTETTPFIICEYGNNTPSILPTAAIAAMWAGIGGRISLAALPPSIGSVVQNSGGEEMEAGFYLRVVDELPFASAAAIIQGSQNRGNGKPG